MTEFIRLDAHERDLLADVVEASFRVVDRHHFYLWTQGIMQSLLPHEILICGVDDGSSESLRMHYFSGSRYFRSEHFDAVCMPHDGLFARVISAWQTSCAPFLLNGNAAAGTEESNLSDLLQRHELKNIAAHGVRAGGRRIAGFYSFSRVPSDAFNRRTAYIAEIVVPHLHTAFLRVLGTETKGHGRPLRSTRAITQREAEILGWIKEGKTNADIAAILGLSPWTIKNHVHQILRKLSAQTRSQAVGRAINLGLLDPDN